MDYRVLGRTGLKLSVLGFGGAEIGYEHASAADVDRIVGAALDAGVNVFDTAECYVDSEQKLGEALQSRRKDLFLFTKCGHAYELDGNDWDPAVLARSIDRSVERLKGPVDLLQLHSCSEETLRDGGVVEVLLRAREAGKTRFIGYSGDSSDAEYAVKTGVFDTLQTSVNIADQEAIDRTLPLASAANMGVIAKRPIANAAWRYETLPQNNYHQEYWRRLQELSYDFTRGEAAVSTALHFTLSAPGVSIAIVGTKSPERFQSNVKLLETRPMLSGEWERIRQRWHELAGPDWTGQT